MRSPVSVSYCVSGSFVEKRPHLLFNFEGQLRLLPDHAECPDSKNRVRFYWLSPLPQAWVVLLRPFRGNWESKGPVRPQPKAAESQEPGGQRGHLVQNHQEKQGRKRKETRKTLANRSNYVSSLIKRRMIIIINHAPFEHGMAWSY